MFSVSSEEETPWARYAQLVGQPDAIEEFPDITGRGQTVAVLDTGIDYSHPLLGGGFGPGFKVVAGHDFVDDDDDPMDTYGHGTAVAGIIASDAFVLDGRQRRGIAPDAKLVALRIDERDQPVPDSRIEQALRWVLNHRAELDISVVNISFGYGNFPGDEVSPVFGDELASLADAGVLVVASSGNGGVGDEPGVQYPAADPNVLAIGATDSFGTITEYTERGRNLDLLAPGEEIATTDIGGDADSFQFASGTSFASPLVAGAAALLLQADPALTRADLRSILRASAAPTVDGDDEFGATTTLTYPRVRLDQAIALTVARRGGGLGEESDGIGPDGNTNDVAYDADGVLHFVYYDVLERTLKHMTRSVGGDWSNARVIDDDNAYLGQYFSLALDPFGRPAVAYFDGTAGDLKFAQFDGRDWDVVRIDANRSVGLYPSLVFDRSARPVISYYYKSGGDLRLARLEEEQWAIGDLDTTQDVGRSSSIAMSRDGRLAIAYENSTTGQLKYARQGTSSWSRTVVDSSTLGIAWLSLVFDRHDRPGISYYDANPANLKYAQQKSSVWSIETLAAKGAQGLYSSLVYDDAGRANIFYYNRQLNVLMRARGNPGAWEYKQLESDGGRYVATALDPRNRRVTYTWFDPDEYTVNVEDA